MEERQRSDLRSAATWRLIQRVQQHPALKDIQYFVKKGLRKGTLRTFRDATAPRSDNFFAVLLALPDCDAVITDWLYDLGKEREVRVLSPEAQRFYHDIAGKIDLARQEFGLHDYAAAAAAAKEAYDALFRVEEGPESTSGLPAAFLHQKAELLHLYARIQIQRGVPLPEGDEPGGIQLADAAYTTWQQIDDPRKPYFLYDSRRMGITSRNVAADLADDPNYRREAVRIMPEVVSLFEAMPSEDKREGRLWFWIERAEVLLRNGDLEDAEQVLAEADQMVAPTSPPITRAHLLRTYALAHLLRQDLRKALQEARAAARLVPEKYTIDWTRCQNRLIGVLTACGRHKEAKQKAVKVLSTAEKHDFRHQAAIVRKYLQTIEQQMAT